jgi:hypothetical protein
MKKLKKVLKITALILFLLIGFLFAAPYLFKSQIVAFAKKEINKSLNAKVDFKGVDISFFRHFPKVAVALDELQVIGINEFAEDTLISAKRIDAAVNIMSVIKGENMTIYSVAINEPRIHALVTKEGKANWDIVKPDSTATDVATEEKPFQMQLQKYSISNGYIKYDDKSSDMSAELTNLNHEGSGDFSSDLFTLTTKTKMDELSFIYGGIPYFANTQTGIDLDIKVDNKTNTYTFKTDKINLNDLKLSADGFFQMANDSVYRMDIKFNAPKTNFKNILSLIPVIYSKDFKDIQTSGDVVFNGFVKGTYSNTQIPAYNINLDVKNGFFQYPDLPKPVKNINLELRVDNPDGITDHTVINIPKGHIEIDNDPFDFRLLVKNPVSDLFIDAAAKGMLDLSKVAQLVKLEAGTKLAGLLNADVNVAGSVNAIQNQQYVLFNAGGTIDLTNFFYSTKDYPDGIKLDNLQSSFNPRNVVLSDISGRYLKTNFKASGQINNLLAYVLKNDALDGSININADKINLNDWMGVSTDATTPTTAAASQPFVVPDNIDFVINAIAGEVHYDKLDIKNLSGTLQIGDETVQLKNVKGNALDGTMIINGSYSTAESKKQPAISLTYDVKDLDVEKTFFAFNTVQKLMPIGQFIAGKLNSQLTMKGKLGENMMPDLSSLTGNGNLLLIQGFLSKFKPLEQIGQILNIKELDKVSIKDVKNYIDFADGKVLVKPFKTKVKGIEMEIGGFHGFDQSLDYTINMKVPRSLMGESGNAYVNNLIIQVNNKGIPVKVGDIVPIQIKLGGSIKNPQVKADLKQAGSNLAEDLKKQVVDFAKAKADSTKAAVTKAVKDSAESAKKQVAKIAEDEIKKKLLGSKDTTATGKDTTTAKKKLEETGKGLIKDLFKKKQKDTAKKG